MEEASAKSIELFKDFYENALVGFHIFGSDSIIININQAELDMIGFTYDEIVGKKRWSDLIISEQTEKFEKHWKTINEMGVVRNIEYTLKHKDGHYVYVILNGEC